MKYIVSLAIIITTILTVSAGPSLMLSAGIDYSMITGDDTLVTFNTMRPGYNIKFGLEQRFFPNFSLVTGISLETRGEQNILHKNLTPTITQDIQENINILNLQLPFLAQGNFPFGIFCVNVFAGPDVGIFLSGEKKRTLTVNIPAVDNTPARSDVTRDTLDFSKKMKMMVLDLNVGAGLEINTGDIGAVFLRGGYQFGLIDISPKGSVMQNYENLFGKHKNIYLSFGYKFNIGTDEE